MFEAEYEKVYGKGSMEMLLKRSTSELQDRKTNFRKAVTIIDDINSQDKSFSTAINFISVMTTEEKARMNNLRVNETEMEQVMRKRRSARMLSKRQNIPDTVDWLARGAQPAVKNQGGCGSCWAFGAVSALEGNYFISTGDLVTFSEQEYVDCTYENMYENRGKTWAKDSNGCNGAWMNWAYMYSEDADRLASMADFPYKSKDETCDMTGVSNALTKMKVTGTEYVRGSDEELKTATSEGIVTVAILVVNSFHYYRQGIYSCTGDCDCSTSINHAVTVVGYTNDYWNVRNSWGQNWGDGGYIKMSRKQDNICNINKYAQRPELECREESTCEQPDFEEEKEEKQEEEVEFDIGNIKECGAIVHFGDKCITMDDTSTKNVTLDSMCDTYICHSSLGYLQDKASKLCITTNQGENYKSPANNEALHFSKCTMKSAIFMKSEKGFKHWHSGKCWHPMGSSANPSEGTGVMVADGCDEDKQEFQFQEEVCWEEQSGKKLGKKLKDSSDKQLKFKTLEKAEDMCVELGEKECKGIYYQAKKKKYSLSGSSKVKKSADKTDKVWIQAECKEACGAGTQRCEDGDCKEQCEDNDAECPEGTKKCADGICKHEHMCH